MKIKSFKALAAFFLVFLLTPQLTAGAYTEKKASGSSSYLIPAASYNSGMVDKDGGVLEITAFNPHNDKLYSINRKAGVIDVVSIAKIEKGVEILMDEPEFTINVKEKLKNLSKDSPFSSFEYGDMTSIAMSPENAMIAVALQDKNFDKNGIIVFLSYEGDVIRLEWAGKQPNMITFTPGGRYLLSTNEGEPRSGYGPGKVDPEGSVSVIDLFGKLETAVPETPGPGLEYIKGKDGKTAKDKNGNPLIKNSLVQILTKDGKPFKDSKGNILTVPGAHPSSSNTVMPVTIPKKPTKKVVTGNKSVNVDFKKFDEKREELVKQGVVIKKNTMPSVDFEPQNIAVDSKGKYAYITLQEANSIAVLDIEKTEITDILPLGFKDHSMEGNEVDIVNDKKIDIRTQPVYGIYMPDGIATYDYKGRTYILTANEGDAREWGDYTNEIEGKDGTIYFNNEDYDGLPEGKKFIFGGRSFSVWTRGDHGGLYLVYDSGNSFEKITADVLPGVFNVSSSGLKMDSRSPKKGPEPESIVTGEFKGQVYAFIGLERTGGIALYNITDPENIYVESYINTRDFSEEIAGDCSPEGLIFIPPSHSPDKRPLLTASFEVSGTVRVFELIAK